jgi:hypothetical protein
VWLDHGKMLKDGHAPDVVAAYLENVNQAEEQHHAAARGGQEATPDPTRAVCIDAVELLDAADAEVTAARTGAPLRVRVHLEATETVAGAVVSVGIRHENGLSLARSAMKADTGQLFEGRVHVDLDVPELPFGAGEFPVDVDVFDSHHMVRFDHREQAAVIHVVPGGTPSDSVVDLKGTWSGPRA